MDRYPCPIDVSDLKEALAAARWKVDGTGILMANGQWKGVPFWVMNHIDPFLQELSKHIGPRTLCHVMVNTLLPAGASGTHVDPSPGGVRHERWHLPLVTNPGAKFWQEGMSKSEHLDFGWWHGPVRYWTPHYVVNLGGEPRTHLVIDVLE